MARVVDPAPKWATDLGRVMVTFGIVFGLWVGTLLELRGLAVLTAVCAVLAVVDLQRAVRHYSEVLRCSDA